MARAVLWVAVCLGLVACGGGGSSSSEPTVPAQPPPPQADTATNVEGVVATGAALSGAEVRVLDASGVDLGISVTSAPSGGFRFSVPSDTLYPLVVIASREGEMLRALVADGDAVGGTVTALVNPITDAVAEALVGDDETALAAVVGDAITRTGDELVEALLGANVKYHQFASDTEFVAAAAEDAGVPSVADTVLDTLGELARVSGQSVETVIQSARQIDAKLLEQPSFQVRLVGEMLARGNSAEQLEQRFARAGVLTSANTAADGALRAAAAGVATALAVTAEATGGDQLAANAVVNAIAAMIGRRLSDGSSQATATLASEEVARGIAAIVTSGLSSLLDADFDMGASTARAELLARASEEAGKLLAALSDKALGSQAGQQAAANAIEKLLLPADVGAAIQAVAAGSAGDEAIPELGRTIEIQNTIRASLPDEVDASQVEFQPVPGVFDQSRWGEATYS